MADNVLLKHYWAVVTWFILCWTLSEQVNYPPRFRNIQKDTVASVPENARRGDGFFTVFVSDADGPPLTFTVVNPKDIFEFDQNSLRISLQNAPITEFYINLTVTGSKPGLDFEKTEEYIVTLQVADALSKATANLKVKVLNANDNPPVLVVNKGTASINEETPIGTSLDYSITFSDTDVNDNVYVGLMGSDASVMNINPSTGSITLNSLIDLDPNTEYKVYNPIVFASDGKLTSSATLTLTVQDINDNNPTCNPSTIQADVQEELPGSRVAGVLNCTDRDSAYNNNNKLSYTITQGDSSLFSVDSSGTISVLSPLDYEKKKSEVVTVKVEDQGLNGRLSTTATVSVAVKPANDISPVWGVWRPDVPPDMTYSVSENAPLGTSILTILATDADLDLGNDVTYSMIVTASDGLIASTDLLNSLLPVLPDGSQQPDAFSLDSLTGLFSTHSALQRDGPFHVGKYTVIFKASDGIHVINRTINIVVKDVNDNAPKFVGVPYPVVVLQEEASKAGTLVTKVTATDEDSTSTNLAFSVGAVLSGNTPLSAWRFSPTQLGELELASNLDLDIDNPPDTVSVLRLFVRDNGIPELTGTATLTVRIVPDNEYSPTITSQPGRNPVQVAEDTPARTQITRIEAQDQDKGQEGVLVYSLIAGNTGQAFSIASDGWISTQVQLDRETLNEYILTVLISDSAEKSPRSVTTTVTIQVTDVDDNTPSCPSDVQTVAILENSAVNTIVTTFSCTDADSGDILAATVKPPLDSIFGFNSPKKVSTSATSWELKLLQGVDYDSTNQTYVVEILVSDGKISVPVKITVSLTAVNEFNPVFPTNPTVPVPENVIRNPVIVYKAEDADYSPHDVVSYKISSVSNGGAPLFNIETRTGSLVLLSALDYETLPAGDKSYRIVVIAEDGGGLQGTGTVTVQSVDANDNPPLCGHSLFFLQVSEKQNGNGPYPILSDLDCTDQEDGKSLNYSMTQSPGDHFALSNGTIQLKSNSLDYETSQAHNLVVSVADKGSPSLTSTVTVYIAVTNENDGGPAFSVSSPVSVSETAAIGQFVADLVAIDPDGNDPEFGDVQYSILSGDTQNQFFLDAQTGRLSTRKKLDFETIKSYNLLIQAKEKKGPNSSIMTQIVNVTDVNDEKPVCAVLSFVVTVPESEPVDYTVVDLMCQDADAGTVLTYTITSGNTTYFKMQDSKVKLKTPLDFEVLPTNNDLFILVSDSVTSHDVSVSGTVVTGSVDEGPPKFDNATYTIHVMENQAVYSNIYTMKAEDPDSPRDQNGQVKYSFLTPYSLFSIDPQTGQIFLAGPLDREREATHALVVKAEDSLRSSSATLFVVVDDVNDNPPRFKFPVYRGAIPGTDPAGTSVLTVQATDADDPNFNQYGVITYQLTGSSDFTINAVTGVITNTVRLDTQNGSRLYSLTATATDSGGAAGSLSSISIVNIQVTTSNRFAPVFTEPSYSMTVRENQFKINDVILEVTALDSDSGADGELTLTLVSAGDKFGLTPSGNTGQLRLQQNLDFDNGDTEFTFEVTATDKGTPPQTGTCIVTILVDDTKDKAALCPRYINLDKVEGETFLTRIVCSGTEGNRTISFTINSTTPNSIQPTISRGGILTTQTPLDYETSKLYQITIQAKDSGSPTFSTIIVRLYVIDVNDNDPTFRGPLAFDLPENTTAGSTVLYTVLADGNDGPNDKVTFTLVDTTYFYITPDTGEMSLSTAAPDYETIGSTYTTVVCIEDSPNPVVRTACSNVTVHILDSNDELPKFSPQVYQVTVAEDAEVGRSLVNVTAIDKDVSLKYRSITYSIKEGNTDGCFRVLSNGVIDLIKMLDYETTQTYTLIVEASDGVHSATAQCYITVSPVNEFAPVFPTSSTTIHVEENVPPNTSVFTALATDSDEGKDGEIRYRMDPGPFVIDSQSGRVSVIGRLDREFTPSYSLRIMAVDQGTNPKNGTLLVEIIVDDVNDHAPACNTNSYALSVPESFTPNDTLVALSCVDDDDDPAGLNNALSYTIFSVPADVFTIDQVGHVKLKNGASLDRETEAAYTINITVSDKGPKMSQSVDVTVSVTVTDVNDNSPFFTSLQAVSVPENTPPGTVITTIEAADYDEGLNKQLIYQIIGGNPGNVFSLNPTSGDLILSRSLDFELGRQYELLVTVMDRGSPARSATGTLNVTISDVNNTPPKCPTAIPPVTKLESSTNEVVFTVSCDDQDETGDVVYSITGGNDGNFVINADTGVISTKPNARLDFESVQSYVLEVTAFDGIYSDVATVRVNIADVNEFRPKIVPPGPITVVVPEDAEANYPVYEFTATDQDTGDSVKMFSIVSGNAAQRFKLDDQTGKLQLQYSLDYESVTSYRLTVAVHDSGNLNDTVEIDINVTDVNDNTPTCQDKSVTLTVLEGARPSTLYRPSCTDADKKASPVLEYSLPAGSHRAFAINNSTGQLSLVEPLDYETNTVVMLTIVVREKGISLPRETTINIQVIVDPVNEFDPVFQPTNSYGPYNIPENTVTGTVVLQVVATDADKGLRDGIVHYAISAGDPQGSFYMDEASGEIHLAQQLNREVLNEFTLSITASDSTPGSDRSRSATAKVKLTITDVNDHRPQLIPAFYSLNVSETSNYGPSVVLAHLIVKDEDEGNNSFTTIAITSGNSENKFTISDHDLILRDQLDYETTNFYELLLELTDHGQPSLRSSGRVRIKVIPENEAAPRMKVASDTLTIPENSPLGTLVYSTVATDTDNEIHGQITYSIDGNNLNEFTLDPNSGQLFVNAPLDYDVLPNMYNFTIRATDGAGASDPFSSTVSLRINLMDVNDNAPKCSAQLVNMTVAENVALGTQVGVIQATDADSKENGEVKYSQTGGNGNSYFNVDPISGTVTTTDLIDYEMFQTFYLSVMVYDGGKPSLITNCLIKVDVANLNDNFPVVSPQDLTVTVLDSTPAGETVMSYSVSDLDTAISSFSFATMNPYFEATFKNRNGAVRTKSSLAFATTKIHTLYIEVKDMATQADSTIHTSTATLTIIVDSTDHSLVINGDYNTSLPENTAVNEIVFKINATDKDGGALANLTYDISDGNVGGAFSIDPQGFVQVARNLDRETVPTYLLTISVTDQRTPPGKAETQAYITLTDINDNSPVFTQGKYVFTIAEKSPVGFSVGTLQASDADSGDNAKLGFGFDSFAVGKMSDFSLHPTSGVITVAASLNSKINPSYAAKVKAMDSGTQVRSSLAQVIINIKEDINHEPVFQQATYSAILDERAEPGTFILQVFALDNDMGTNGELSYFLDTKTLDGPVAKDYLEVNKTNGNLYTLAAVTYEQYKEFRIMVLAVDRGSPALAGNTTVTISVRDINDHSPVFRPKFYNTEVAFNGKCKNSIVTVIASDEDLGKNGELSYFLQIGADQDLFEVVSDSGEVKLKNVALPNMGYKLEIQAKDAGQPVRRSVSPSKIRVDTFVPSSVVVTFRLGISRNDFLADVDKFIANLEKVIQTKYPFAVVRLWCVVEYDGVAVTPAKSFRRLLADMPVDANMYALQDNSTDSEDNFNKDKNFVPQEELLALVADNPEGDPNSNVQGDELDYLNITNVRAYREGTEQQGSSLAETNEMVFIILAIVVCLILIAIMICLLMRFCCRLYGSPLIKKRKLKYEDSNESRNEKDFNIRYIEPDIIKAKPKQDTETEVQTNSSFDSDIKVNKGMDPLVMMAPSSEIHLPLPRFAVVKLNDATKEDTPESLLNKSYLRQSSDGSSLPPKKLQTLSSLTESSATTTTSNPRAVVITIKNPLTNYNKLTGKSNDDLTNKNNEYNAKTKKQQNKK